MKQIMLPNRSRSDRPFAVTFAPLAWLKLQLFCHAGDTEIGGFGISSEKDLLYIEDFRTVRQQGTPVSVQFADAAVADYFDACVDQGLRPARFARLWLHTHPGSSAAPSSTDEDTFARVFGGCDWAVMFILSRTEQTYARLAFSAGPGGQLLLPVQVDWSAWPDLLDGKSATLATLTEQWRQEFTDHIQFRKCDFLPALPRPDGQRHYADNVLDRDHLLEEWAGSFLSLNEEFIDDEWVYQLPDREPGSAAAADHSPRPAG